MKYEQATDAIRNMKGIVDKTSGARSLVVVGSQIAVAAIDIAVSLERIANSLEELAEAAGEP